MEVDTPGPAPQWAAHHRVDGPAAGAATTHLVVGYDLHPASAAALRYAVALAPRLDAHVHALHAVDVEDLPIDPDSPDWEDRIAQTVARERDAACRILGELPGNWTYHSRAGEPAQALLDLADAHDAAMIFIGRPSRDFAARLGRLLGESTSARLVHRSRRPVVLVPADNRAAL